MIHSFPKLYALFSFNVQRPGPYIRLDMLYANQFHPGAKLNLVQFSPIASSIQLYKP